MPVHTFFISLYDGGIVFIVLFWCTDTNILRLINFNFFCFFFLHFAYLLAFHNKQLLAHWNGANLNFKWLVRDALTFYLNCIFIFTIFCVSYFYRPSYGSYICERTEDICCHVMDMQSELFLSVACGYVGNWFLSIGINFWIILQNLEIDLFVLRFRWNVRGLFGSLMNENN